MIRDVGNIETCKLLETEPKTQCKVCLSYWDVGIVYCTCGHILRKGRGANHQFINYTMDLLSVPEYVIKKGRPHGHRYGKKPGDKEYYSANQLKKKCKKNFFQGINDRLIRDPEFRNRMIANNRDEELCRNWDALADEDHTHHVTSQEYSLYKSNWWLHSNKQGSNTVRMTHRSDFKKGIVYRATIETKKKEPHKRPRTLTEINNGHKVLHHGGVGKVLGGLLIPLKVTMEMKQVLIEQGDLSYKYLEQVLRA